jgi:hypothetical protein
MKLAPFIIGLAAVASAGLVSAAAQAQNARSFVSGHGLDTNACTVAAPCRTFAAAILMTNTGGEIDALDPAGYGSFTITKAISIIGGDDNFASITVPVGGAGIAINAGPTDVVSLRGLVIDGLGLGQTGIIFNTGQALDIDNCVIRHVTGDGVDFLPSAASSLVLSDTLVGDNGGNGLVAQPTGSGAVTVVVTRSRLNNNTGNGLNADDSNATGSLFATAANSIASGNRAGGFVANAAAATLMLIGVTAANNATGISASGATLRLAQSTVTGNTNGWLASNGGAVLSYGDNHIDGNTNNQNAPTPPLAKK